MKAVCGGGGGGGGAITYSVVVCISIKDRLDLPRVMICALVVKTFDSRVQEVVRPVIF